MSLCMTCYRPKCTAESNGTCPAPVTDELCHDDGCDQRARRRQRVLDAREAFAPLAWVGAAIACALEAEKHDDFTRIIRRLYERLKLAQAHAARWKALARKLFRDVEYLAEDNNATAEQRDHFAFRFREADSDRTRIGTNYGAAINRAKVAEADRDRLAAKLAEVHMDSVRLRAEVARRSADAEEMCSEVAFRDGTIAKLRADLDRERAGAAAMRAFIKDNTWDDSEHCRWCDQRVHGNECPSAATLSTSAGAALLEELARLRRAEEACEQLRRATSVMYDTLCTIGTWDAGVLRPIGEALAAWDEAKGGAP